MFVLPVMFGPNITGGFGTVQCLQTTPFTNGVFTTTFLKVQLAYPEIGNESATIDPRLDASNGNAVYSGKTLQPPACQTLMIIKT